jgi:hypothetical protein
VFPLRRELIAEGGEMSIFLLTINKLRVYFVGREFALRLDKHDDAIRRKKSQTESRYCDRKPVQETKCRAQIFNSFLHKYVERDCLHKNPFSSGDSGVTIVISIRIWIDTQNLILALKDAKPTTLRIASTF